MRMRISERMSTKRTEELKEASQQAHREVSIIRARAFTETYKKFPDKPLIIKRALAFSEHFEKLPISIYENELIVGSITEKQRGAFLVPETNINGMADRGQFDQLKKKWFTKAIYSTAKLVSLINPSLSGKLATANMLVEAKLDSFETRSTLTFSISPNEKKELNYTILPYWKKRNAYTQYRKYLSSKEKILMEPTVAYAAEHQLVGGVFLFHPNLEKVAQTGLGEIIRDAQSKLGSTNAISKKTLGANFLS